ncbi:MAG TPA: hypothetical protein VFR52_04655, partial [Sphingomicrobium sp.]|nr:hypothetical protein [Sphingomicrobium sp.]
MINRRSVHGRLAALPFLGTAAALLLGTAALAQPAPGAGPPQPPPDRSTAVEAGELRETWNDRASQGP